MTEQLFADVILPLPLGDQFTYRVPADFQVNIKVGVRVIVQFGARKFFSALVYRLHNNMPVGSFDIKDIDAILDQEPVVTPAQIILWEWMVDYYCCTLGEVYKASLPSALKLESQTKVSFNPNYKIPVDLPGEEEALLLMLQGHGHTNIQSINKFLGKKSALPTLKLLLEKNAVVIEERLEDSYTAKMQPFIFLHPKLGNETAISQALDTLTKAKKQLQLMEFFLTETIYHAEQKSNLSKKELLETSGISESVLRALLDKDFLHVQEIEVGRLDLSSNGEQKIFELNEAQNKALTQIKEQTKTGKPVLLHGVTSSGKTEVYIKLIEEQLALGKQVLYLVPEIGLTTQLINRLKRAFGDKAGIYHSRFNDGERVEIWMNTLHEREKSFHIIIGARSAALLPFRNLGLIIVDEEHENSYKQFDPSPRYNARDLAIVLAQIHRAQVILGTATPSFESYFNVKTKKYALVELTERYQNISLPEMQISDVREATRRKQMKSLLTPALYEAVDSALKNDEQVILFQNRRGFAPYIQCNTCGWIPKCKNCDVSLTYHKNLSALICHYCGHTHSLPGNCPDCHSEEIKTRGFGTEKIEEELGLLFPEARIARMDMDSTRAKKAYERLIYQFESKQIDILVGTQMVTKGLDFDHVRVVGILNADQLLNYPDFRSYERSYQLIAQVSGRAGRKNKQGKVIIQTSQPQHPVLQELVENNFMQLFNRQMAERQLFKYPPYFRLVKVVLKHKNKERLNLSANQLATKFRKLFGFNILGPEYPLVGRIQTWYQKEIWIKLERDQKLGQSKAKIIDEIKSLKAQPNNGNLIVFADVDPM
ncbi:replication restart helicase PriA [Mangrovibacterium lignilyticum]|uniref:replication restart helicase PriA n=1 Tax=Mangrovibacterium lignilyticum TaxID=2668052 RepID=UPI0013D6E9BD|nr:primosomal protein N' [Mangrovibacterium lignilyticum]